MVGLPRGDRGSLGLRSLLRDLRRGGAGPGGRGVPPVGSGRRRIAAAVDRVRDVGVVEGANGGGPAGDDGGAGIVFREVEGVGRRPIQEWVYRVGAESWGHGL